MRAFGKPTIPASVLVLAVVIGTLALGAATASAVAWEGSTEIDSITEISYDSAHATGVVHGGSLGTIYSWEISTDDQNWTLVERVGPINGGDNPVSTEFTGLKGGTKYFVRLADENFQDGEIVYSPQPDPSFTTLVAAPPVVEEVNAPSEIGYSFAAVSGVVNRPADSNDLSCAFEYVTDAQFTASGFAEAGQVDCGTVSTVGPSPVNAMLFGLTSGTTYHLRLTVTNASASGTKEATSTFETKPATAPTVTVGPASEVEYTTAHVTGSVDPEGGNEEAGSPAPITWEFQYSPDPATFGWSSAGGAGTIEAPQSGESDPIPLSTDIVGLQNGTEYKFRLIAYYPGNVAVSPEGTFTTETVSKPAVTVDDATAVTGTTAHLAGVVRPGNVDPAFNSSCAFDYVADRQFQVDGFASAQSIPCSPLDPNTGTVNGPDPVAVHADLEDLEPNTLYHLRLQAINQGGETAVGAANFETAKVAPGVQTLFAGNQTANSAALSGKVNPHDSAVTYQFEWGTSAAYGHQAPAAMTPLGILDNSLHLVTVGVTGLQPGTTYHFRLVAVNTETGQTAHGNDHTFTTTGDAGPAACPNEVVRAEANSQELPDCRAYEMTMPAVKDYPFGQLNLEIAVAAPDGNSVAYLTFGPMPGAKSGTQENYNLASRGGAEWTNNPISPPQTADPTLLSLPITSAFSQNLHFFGFQGNPPLAGAPEGVSSLFVGNTQNDAYTYLGTQGTQTEFEASAQVHAITDDGSHVVFKREDPGDPGARPLYEWVNGSVRVVSILPDGTETVGYFGQGGGVGLGYHMTNALSADGNRIVWTDGSQVYERIDGTETVQLSASQRAVPDPAGSGQATFWGASSNGGKVFFTSTAALAESATPGGTTDLYEYDLASRTLTDLTASAGGTADVQGVVGNSDDGGDVYFVARGAFADGAEKGANNLYLSRGGSITYIASLDDADSAAWGLEEYSLGSSAGTTARVSSDGHLAFQSIARLTGYDNTDPKTGEATSQMYLYSPESSSLVCASCRPDGSPPEGNSTIRPPHYGTNTPRNLSDDGSRLFFDSTDAIVPADVNGKPDVYEYAEGGVHLISDGRRNFTSVFQDASASGDDVFFSTRAKLVGQDVDERTDLYDARVDGGFPAPPPVAAGCEGEGCRGQGTATPAGATATTQAFVGPGNQPEETKKTKKKHHKREHQACKAKHGKKKGKKCASHHKKRAAKKSGRGK